MDTDAEAPSSCGELCWLVLVRRSHQRQGGNAVADSATPIMLRRHVALRLKQLRIDAGLSREQVRDHLRCSLSHVTQLETQRVLPKPSEVRDLLPLYGAADQVEPFLDLVDNARRGKEWWAPYKGAAPSWLDLLLSMEAAAAQIESYDSMTVPGLFQTPAYARQVIMVGEPELSDSDVASRVDLRMARQDVLTRQPTPPLVWSVLDESVLLRHPCADPAVLTEQLRQLVKLIDLPTVTIQILPLRRLTAGMNGTFTVLTFPTELVGDPGAAYTETRAGGNYHEDPADLQRYRNTLTHIQGAAYTPEESRTILIRRIEELAK